MALNRVAHHLPEFRQRFALGGNGVAERDRHI
jgi:hypothetical protein